MENIYYSPEKFGAELIGAFEWSEPSWSFDTCAVWKTKRGEYWIGNDSGCSCPSPFEYVTDINELDGPHNKAGLEARLKYLVDENTKGENTYGYSKSHLLESVQMILDRIK